MTDDRIMGDRLAAVRIATQVGVIYEEIEQLKVSAPHLLARLFDDLDALVADLDAVMDRAERIIAEGQP